MTYFWELHDSEIISIESLNGLIKIIVDPAIVFDSLDSEVSEENTHYKKLEVHLRVSKNSISSPLTTFEISDGQLKLGEKIYDNVIKIPLEYEGQVILTLIKSENLEEFKIECDSIKISLMES